MTSYLINFLKFIQFCSVIVIPFVVIRHLLPAVGFFAFAQGALDFTNRCIAFFNPVVNGIDLTIAFLMLPWIAFILLAEMLSKMILSAKNKSEEIDFVANNKKILVVQEKEKTEMLETLQKKQVVYAVVKLIFSKFTISDVSEDEIELKKEDVKTRLFQDAMLYKGKAIDGVDFEDDDTIALIFLSQEDALNFVFKLKSTIAILDSDIQDYGYSLHFKAILDSQGTESQKLNIFEFLEKVLQTSEENEISATSTFSQRYAHFGTMKHVSFDSKGSYHISKQRIELFRLNY